MRAGRVGEVAAGQRAPSSDRGSFVSR